MAGHPSPGVSHIKNNSIGTSLLRRLNAITDVGAKSAPDSFRINIKPARDPERTGRHS